MNAEPPKSYDSSSAVDLLLIEERQTAKDPGAFLAAVQPHPLYNPKPSSRTILTTPRPRNASGFVCRLILRTSRGSRTISPIPITLEPKSVNVPLTPRSVPTFLPTNASSPSQSLVRKLYQIQCRGFSQGNLGRMVVHHIYTLVVKPASISKNPPSGTFPLTLYPAAYPRPGNNEKNFVPTGAAAFSLKMTELSCDADVICEQSASSL